MLKIEPAQQADIFAVALDMRQRDFDEFAAVNFAQTRDELAQVMAERYGNRHDILCGFWRDQPTCIGGFIEARPGVASLLFYATDDFPKIGLGITRFIAKNLFPRLEAAGIHRIEAVSLSSYTETHAWLRTIGLLPETAPLLGYGRNGEPFTQFSRVSHVRPSGA